MAFVIDTPLKPDDFQDAVATAVRAFKRSNEIFRNVRLNLIFWGQQGMSAQVAPMARLMTGTAFAEYVCSPCKI